MVDGKNGLLSSKVAQSTSYFPHALRRLRLCSPRTGGRDRRPRKAPQSPSSICCPEYLYETIHEIVNRWNRMMSGSHTKLSTILRVNISNSWTAASAPRVSQSVTANAITVYAPAPRPASPPRFALVVYERGHRWSWRLARACSREREREGWSRGIWSRGIWSRGSWSRGSWPRDLSSQRWRLWGSRDRRLGAFSFSQPRPRPSPARTGEPRRELSRAALHRSGESRSAPHPTRASSCRGESPSRRVRGVSPARVSYSRRRRRSRFVRSSSVRRRS